MNKYNGKRSKPKILGKNPSKSCFSVELEQVRFGWPISELDCISVLQLGSDVFNDETLSGIGLAVKSPRVAFFNVVHDRPATNSVRMRIAAIDKSTPLYSLGLKRHLTLPH